MWTSFTRLHLFMLINIQGCYCTELDVTDPSESPDTVYRSRCTRRFTPGMCEEQPSAVWTFVFHLQNCTERLGCPASHRTNRFRSYRNCMRRCHPLVDIYLQMLAVENYSSIFYLRNTEGGRRGDLSLLDLKGAQQDEDYKDEISSSGEPLFNMYYRDDPEVEVSLAPDIDYVVRQNDDVTEDVIGGVADEETVDEMNDETDDDYDED